MEKNQESNTLPAPWNESIKESSFLSKSSSSSIVLSSDGSFPYTMDSHTHPSSESSNQSSAIFKEHDYIGLAEVSSSCSSVNENENDGMYAFDDTELRLSLGPLKEDLPVSSVKSSLLELDLLEPKNRISQDTQLAFGSTPSTVVSQCKNGLKRAYGEALGKVEPSVNTAAAKTMPIPPLLDQNHNLYTSNQPAPTTNGFYSNTNDESRLGNLQNNDSALPAKGQVVGWPPVRSYRKNTLPTIPAGDAGTIYVKVNMDGMSIGRKVDLNAYRSYESLLGALEEMFYCPNSGNGAHFLSNSEFVLTYEDKEGDWMLVGDVPWGMFVNTVKRLRIMRGLEATGSAPKTLR